MMNTYITSIVLFLFILFHTVFATIPQANKVTSEVHELTMQNYVHLVNDEKRFTLLLVYNPWFPWCQIMLEELPQIWNILKHDNMVQVAKINTIRNPSIESQLVITEYPSLFLIHNKTAHKYEGEMKMRHIILWMYQHLDSRIYEVHTIEKLNSYLSLDEYNNLITLFVDTQAPLSGDDKENELIKELIQFCSQIQLTYCLFLKNKEIIDYIEKEANVRLSNARYHTILYKNNGFDDKFHFPNKSVNVLYDKNLSSDDRISVLRNFLRKNQHPLIILFSELSYGLIFSADFPSFFIIYKNKEDIDTQIITQVAKPYANAIRFVLSGSSERAENRLLNELMISEVTKPIMRIIQFKHNMYAPYKYKPSSDDILITEETISSFIDGYFTNPTAYFYRKSEKMLPDDINQGYVKIIVADSYDDVIFNNDNHVMVLYYASWCGYCRKFEPIYREIGKRLNIYSRKHKDYKKDLIWGKIDSVNNDIYNLEIVEYPTLYLYVKSKKDKPIKYNKARNILSIMTWVKEQTNINIDVNEFISLRLEDEQLFENYEEL